MTALLFKKLMAVIVFRLMGEKKMEALLPFFADTVSFTAFINELKK